MTIPILITTLLLGTACTAFSEDPLEITEPFSEPPLLDPEEREAAIENARSKAIARERAKTEQQQKDAEEELREIEELKRSNEQALNKIRKRTSEYRVKKTYSTAQIQSMWRNLVTKKLCLHGSDMFFSKGNKFQTAMNLAYNEDEKIVAFLSSKLTSTKPTKIHLGPGVDNAVEYQVALLLLELRTECSITGYQGDDVFIAQSFQKWRNALKETDDVSADSNYELHERNILFNDEHRNALLAYFKKCAEKVRSRSEQ